MFLFHRLHKHQMIFFPLWRSFRLNPEKAQVLLECSCPCSTDIVHLYLIHLHCSTTVIFFKSVFFNRNISIVFSISFSIVSPLPVKCSRASMELWEHLLCRFEVFLGASLPPDGASGALVTNGRLLCPLKTSLPSASCMKSTRLKQPGTVWSSPFCSTCPCKSWRWLHEEGKSHKPAALCVARSGALCQTPKLKRAMTVAAQTYHRDLKFPFMCAQFVPVPYPPLCGMNSLLICISFLRGVFQVKTEQFCSDATENPSFRYFLCPHGMTQSTSSLSLTSIPRRLILKSREPSFKWINGSFIQMPYAVRKSLTETRLVGDWTSRSLYSQRKRKRPL